MADLTSVRQKIQDALDEADLALGQETTTQQIAVLEAQIAALTANNTTLTSAKATLQAKIDAARSAAQADKDADVANVAGQGVLDALS